MDFAARCRSSLLETIPFGVPTLMVLSVLLMASRPAQAQTETVLYNFCSLRGTCPDGADPLSRLTAHGAGKLYGTTHAGSSRYGSYGDVFELSPNGAGGWNETVLYAFTDGTDGAYPQYSPVIFDKLGNLYGTTQDGGIYGNGTVFELHPTGESWTETAIYSFAGTGDGSGPDTGVIIDSKGNLYGTTYHGGPENVGTIFELSPSDDGWTEQVIYTFDSSLWFPPSGLTMDAQGKIFGAANLEVFELSPNGSGGGVIVDGAGKLYGTADSGGSEGFGVIFEVTP